MNVLASLSALNLVLLAFAIFLVPISWDEGWNFCVARTLLEHGHYGCLINGELTTARLSTGWPTVLPSALGFLASGNSYVAARALIGCQSLLAVTSLILLAEKLWNRRVAVGTSIVLLLFSGDPRMHPMLLGGQVWGEMPAILAIVLGFLMYSYSASRKGWGTSAILLILAGMFFGLALSTKIQTRPFVLCAAIGALLWCVLSRYLTPKCPPGISSYAPSSDSRTTSANLRAMRVVIVWAMAYITWSLLEYLPLPYISKGMVSDGSGTQGAYEVFALVTDFNTRAVNIQYVAKTCWLYIVAFAILGIKYAYQLCTAPNFFKEPRELTVALYCLSCSWFLWFLFLAVNFPRYLAPAVILGAPFIAKVLCDWTYDLDFRRCRAAFRDLIASPGRLRMKAMVLTLIILVFCQALFTVRDTASFLWVHRHDNNELFAVAEYINKQTPSDALIETYDAQLFYLLNRKFHYPPDQVNIDAVALNSGRTDVRIDYDPLAAKPDYLVVGPWSRYAFKIYDSAIREGKFRKIDSIGEYEIYVPA